jgi:hypothetical protein
VPSGRLGGLTLFPPSSRIVCLNLFAHSTPTSFPRASLPVKLIKSTRGSATSWAPTAPPPTSREQSAPGRLWDSRTEVMIRVVAIAQSGVVSAGFQIEALPQMNAREKFQPKTYGSQR